MSHLYQLHIIARLLPRLLQIHKPRPRSLGPPVTSPQSPQKSRHLAARGCRRHLLSEARGWGFYEQWAQGWQAGGDDIAAGLDDGLRDEVDRGPGIVLIGVTAEEDGHADAGGDETSGDAEVSNLTDRHVGDGRQLTNSRS